MRSSVTLRRRPAASERRTVASPLFALAALLASAAVFLSLSVFPSWSAATEAVPDLTPPTPAPSVARLAYVTASGSTPSRVWLASITGSEPKLLGLGEQPLLSPNGQSVAVGLFGATADSEHGPALGIYPADGAPIANYLDLETATATPLAWSPDSRYLAVDRQSNETVNIAAGSGLDVIDTQTGTVTSIAEGAIYGASFARDGSDKLVFALAHSLSPSARTNLYVSEADGAGMHPITSDGRSLDPVWGPSYIAYDRERMRRLSPEYQIWLAPPTGGGARKLTHIGVGALVQGLVPLQFSASGSRLLAEFEGEDTSSAYAVNVASGRAREVHVHGRSVQAAGISSDGSTLLVDANAFEQPLSHGQVVSVPFGGGRAKVLTAHGSEGSWNG